MRVFLITSAIIRQETLKYCQVYVDENVNAKLEE